MSIAQIVGSKKTIFHRHGYDDVASLIYDPACTLDNEIVVVPQGCDPGAFIFKNELDAETIPWCVARRYLDVPQTTTITVSPVFEIPSAVTNEALSHRIHQLYQNARPQCLPETVRALRLKWNKNFTKIATAANKVFEENFLQQSGVQFRGLSLKTLAFSMSTFLPVIYTGTMDNEFGPGIYTTEEFDIACRFAGPNGAIMIFKDVDQRELNIWQLNGEQWNSFVSYWLDISLKNVGIPSDYKTADIIHGPMSKNQAEARRKKCYPTSDDCNQRAFVSYEACQRLMTSLTGIIYLSRD